MPTGSQTPEKRAAYNRQYKAIPDNAVKIKAHDILRNALRYGKMHRQSCERCGAEKTHGHHDDYTKPLDVRWFCNRCHAAFHAETRPEGAGRKPQTHCVAGHALTEPNIYRHGNSRICRECHLRRQRIYYRQRRGYIPSPATDPKEAA